jgi:cytochrome bd-type quinol oxidase subunit 1
MGLMGFARSGIRQHWHIYGVMQDRSPDALTPALGYAANVITLTTVLFFLLVMFIFWLGGLGERGHAAAAAEVPEGHPAPVPIAGGRGEA